MADREFPDTFLDSASSDTSAPALHERRFAALANASSTIIWAMTADGRVGEPIPGWQNYTGQSFADARGIGFLDAIHADDQPLVLASWQHALATGLNYDTRYRLRRHDGSWRWVHARGVPVHDDDGQLLEWVGTCVEIEEEVAARHALEDALDKLRFASEAAMLGIYDYDVEAGTIDWDARLRKLWGVGDDEPIDYDTFMAGVHPDDRAPTQARVDAAFDPSGSHRYEAEFRVVHRGDGSIRWIAALGRAYFEGGRPVRLIGTVQEITERRAAEERLHDSEARAQRLFDDASDFMFTADLSQRITSCNASVANALGWERSELIGRSIAEFIGDEQFGTTSRMLARKLRDGGATRYEVDVTARDGTVTTWEINSRLLTDAGGQPTGLHAIARDVGERRRTEAALAASEARFRQLAETIPAIIAIKDRESRLVYANEAYALSAGRPLAELIGRSEADWHDNPDEVAAIIATDARIMASGNSETVEEPFTTLGSGTNWWLSTKAPLVGPDGTVEGLYFVSIDITARKAAEEQALRLAALVEQSRDFVGLADLDGNPLFGNAAALATMGIGSLQELAHILDGFAPEERERIAGEALPTALAQGWWEGEASFLNIATGEVRPYLFTLFAIKDASGAPIGFGTVSRDLTDYKASQVERERADRAIVESESRLRRLIDQLFAFVGVLSPEGIVIDTNRAPREAAGLDAADVGGKPFWETPWWSYDPRIAARIKDAAQRAAAGETARFDTPVMLGDSVVMIDFQIGPLHDDEGAITHLVPSGVIVEDRVRAYRELARLNSELEQRVEARTADLMASAKALEAEMARREEAQRYLVQAQKMEALGQLVGGVAHDFNNILAAVQGAFQILSRRVDDEQGKFVINEGEHAVQRATALIRQMLAFARRETLEPEVVDLGELIPSIERMICNAVGSRIDCKFAAEPGTWPVLVDPRQLEVALLNLAVNARDAMPDGGRLSVVVCNLESDEDRPQAIANGDFVVLSVEDSGCGMPEDVAARIFEPFYTTKPVGKGTGLGLAQVHGFASGAGGAVTASSIEGKGTTISLFLPRSAFQAAQTGVGATVAADVHGGATILLVDDDDQVRPITASYLRELGYIVVDADSPSAAIALAALHPIDVLVTDVVMPEMEGPALAAHVRKSRPDLPVLYITGYAAGRDFGSDRVVLKPFSGDELALHLLETLGRIEPGAARKLAEAPRDASRLIAKLTAPSLRAAYDRWIGCLGNRRMPDLAAFETNELVTDMMAVLRPVDSEDGRQFRVVLTGDGLERRLGRSLAGEIVGPEHESHLGSMHAAYSRCASSLAPAFDWARYRLDAGMTRIERLILPFSSDGAHITELVSFIHFTDPDQVETPERKQL